MISGFLGALVLLQAAAASDPAQEIPLAPRVNRSIALGVDYLKSRQKADGSFPGHEAEHPGGATALVAFTMLRSGVRRNDPALLRALATLAGNEWKSVYSASVHLLLCDALQDPLRLPEAQKSLAFLLEHQVHGVWAYPWSHECNSNTQFALLGLRSARRLGLEVPEQAFVDAAEGLHVFEQRDGGYSYEPETHPAYAGMTAAALASFAVIEEVGRESAHVRAACERQANARKAAEAWIEHHADLTRNSFDDGSWTPFWHFAYLWAIERWCGLTKRERIAGADWYADGASWLCATQSSDGSWTSDDKPLENTCLALLFLRRATLSPDAELAEIYAEIDRLRAERPQRFERPGPAARRLTDWWLAGPWEANGNDVLLLDPPFDPRSVKPRARTKLARRDWERVTLQADGWTDLDKLTQREGDRDLWVLATRLWWNPPPAAGSAPAPLAAWLWLELEDGWDVWLDGVRLSRERRRGAAINGDVRCELELAPGEHFLCVLVEDVAGAAAFGARLTDTTNAAPPAELVSAAEPAERKH